MGMRAMPIAGVPPEGGQALPTADGRSFLVGSPDGSVVLSADGSAYAYKYRLRLSDLFLVDGLR